MTVWKPKMVNNVKDIDYYQTRKGRGILKYSSKQTPWIATALVQSRAVSFLQCVVWHVVMYDTYDIMPACPTMSYTL